MRARGLGFFLAVGTAVLLYSSGDSPSVAMPASSGRTSETERGYGRAVDQAGQGLVCLKGWVRWRSKRRGVAAGPVEKVGRKGTARTVVTTLRFCLV